jgi:hypothetical protein
LVHLEYIFETRRYHKLDPKGLMLKHYEQFALSSLYSHGKLDDEVFTENAQIGNEVLERKT